MACPLARLVPSTGFGMWPGLSHSTGLRGGDFCAGATVNEASGSQITKSASRPARSRPCGRRARRAPPAARRASARGRRTWRRAPGRRSRPRGGEAGARRSRPRRGGSRLARGASSTESRRLSIESNSNKFVAPSNGTLNKHFAKLIGHDRIFARYG